MSPLRNLTELKKLAEKAECRRLKRFANKTDQYYDKLQKNYERLRVLFKQSYGYLDETYKKQIEERFKEIMK